MDPFDSATDLACAIRKRELSPVEIVETYLDRIDRLDPAVGAFVWRDDEAVRAAARRAERATLDGSHLAPFHGVPIPVKDLTQVEGQPATYGSLGMTDAPRLRTEPVIARLLNAGFLLMGRTNTPEAGLLTHNRQPPLRAHTQPVEHRVLIGRIKRGRRGR